MILKYKTKNDAWVYKTLKDFFVSELDIFDVVCKHTDRGLKVLDLTTGNCNNEALFDILNIINKTFDNIYSFNLCTYELTCSSKYILIGYSDGNNEIYKYDCIIINKEAYLMNDDGKTIEKLI
jgi:hypothetical protein